ncbi:DUF4214 domain-containing protein [Pseudomonas aeruginosa]|nr:DUF4214 domain-containing protein [Pseudomonas aeruginosa]
MSTQSDLAELYTTFFDRAPDAGGLAYWVAQVEGGQISLAQVAENWLTQQPEGLSKFPASQTDAQFIEAMYNNLLGRAPDTGGAQYWLDQLQNGTISRDTFGLTLINGAKANTSTQGQQDAAMVSNKATVGVTFAEKGLNELSLASAVVKSVTADANTLSATLAIIGLIPSVTGNQSAAVLNSATQLLTKLTTLITSAPAEVADAATYLNSLLSGATSNTNLVTLLTNANTLLTNAATDSTALDNPASKGADAVVVATPSTGGSSTPTPASLTVEQYLNQFKTLTGTVTISDTAANITSAAKMLAASSNKISSIKASDSGTILLNAKEFTDISAAKLSDVDNITVIDTAELIFVQLSALTADIGKIDHLNVAGSELLVLTAAQYTALGSKLALASTGTIEIKDDTMTAAQIAEYGVDSRVSSIRVENQVLSKSQYEAAKDKLNSNDTIIVVDNTLTESEVLTLGADGKVDDIGVSPLTISVATFQAAGAKLRSIDTINIEDSGVNFTAAALEFITEEIKVVDSITVNSGIITLNVEQAGNNELMAVMSSSNKITVQDSSLNINENILNLLENSKITTIEATDDEEIRLSLTELSSANLEKFSESSNVILIDNGSSLSPALHELVKDQNLSKIDKITACDNLLTLTAEDAAVLGEKLTDTNDVITLINTLVQSNQTIASNVFQSGNDKLQFSLAELAGTGFQNYGLSGPETITYGSKNIELVVAAGATASSTGAAFLFDTLTHVLSYDKDGDGGAVAVPLLTLNGVSTLSVDDFMIA